MKPPKQYKRQITGQSLVWAVHNVVGHPVSELLYWGSVLLERVNLPRLADASEDLGNWVHDVTVPDHPKGEGRG